MQLQPEMWYYKWPLIWMFPISFFWDGKILCFLILCLHCRPLNWEAATRLSSVLYAVIPLDSKSVLLTDSKEDLITATSKLHFCHLNYAKTMGFFSFPESMQNSQPICSPITWRGSNEILISTASTDFHEWVNNVFCPPATNSCAIKYATWDFYSYKILHLSLTNHSTGMTTLQTKSRHTF